MWQQHRGINHLCLGVCLTLLPSFLRIRHPWWMRMDLRQVSCTSEWLRCARENWRTPAAATSCIHSRSSRPVARPSAQSKVCRGLTGGRNGACVRALRASAAAAACVVMPGCLLGACTDPGASQLHRSGHVIRSTAHGNKAGRQSR